MTITLIWAVGFITGLTIGLVTGHLLWRRYPEVEVSAEWLDDETPWAPEDDVHEYSREAGFPQPGQ